MGAYMVLGNINLKRLFPFTPLHAGDRFEKHPSLSEWSSKVWLVVLGIGCIQYQLSFERPSYYLLVFLALMYRDGCLNGIVKNQS